jgi:hypothetical protein
MDIQYKPPTNQAGEVLDLEPGFEDPELTTFFQVDPHSLSRVERDHLRRIRSHINQEAGEDRAKALAILQDLRFRVGAPPLGASYISHLASYINALQAVRGFER